MKKLEIILLMLLLLSGQAHSTELVGGLFFHDTGNLFGGTKTERGIDLGIEVLFGEGLVRPNAGFTVSMSGETSKAYAGIVIGSIDQKIFGRLSIGAAAHINAVRELGSVLLIRLALELGYSFGDHSLSFVWDHISNADLNDQNAGLDIAGFRYGHKF